ncbi:MAG: hypothetical protein ACRDJF_03765 [Actinomycetota bacterium]
MGIVLCLGIAAGAVILATGNGRKASEPATDSSDARRVTTELPGEKLELPQEAVTVQTDPPSQPKSRNLNGAPSTAGSKPPSKAPSESVDRVPPAGGNVPDAGGSAAPGGESSRQKNSAEAHPDRGVNFTRDEIGVEINPGGESGRQDSDDDDADDREVDEGEAEED